MEMARLPFVTFLEVPSVDDLTGYCSLITYIMQVPNTPDRVAATCPVSAIAWTKHGQVNSLIGEIFMNTQL